ncbi:hypothetical protein CPB86DRAFT_793325 [Serendipita vermifera]|nr:hypothetical protein CPB86DRAFT_793325 [Serendipita vermifera]
MGFSLSAKPPKPKPNKGKEKVVVRASGRGGSGNIRRTKVPKTPPSGADLAPTTSTTSGGGQIATSPTPTPLPDRGATPATASQLSNLGSTSNLSKAGSSGSASAYVDLGEAEDRIRAPAGREILTARQRRVFSGRGGAGNRHQLLADEAVYERVLLHEQGIVQAYKDERKEREGRSTGRGGHGNIKKKKSKSTLSDTSSTRTRSSVQSWGSIARKYRRAQGTSTTNSSLSLSPIPALQPLPSNDFATSLASSMIEKGIFERVDEEDETQVAGPSEDRTASTSKPFEEAVNMPQSTPIVEKDSTSAASINSSVSASPAPTPLPFFGAITSSESKPTAAGTTSPSSWLANRLKNTMGTKNTTRAVPPSPVLPSLGKTSIFSSSSGRRTDSPVSSDRQASSSDALALSRSSSSSSTPVINIVAAPSTTPTATSVLRPAASSEKNKGKEPSEEGVSTIRSRQNPLTASNRNVAVYAPQGPGYAASSSSHEDPIAMYSNNSYNTSSLRYLSRPDPYPHSRQYTGTLPSSKALMAQASTSAVLQPPPPMIQSADDATRHSRGMSSSSTSGSDVDVSRYDFPEAPPHAPRTVQREYNAAPLRLVSSPVENQAMMSRPTDSSGERTPTYNKPPSRAPVHPGAYQAALRAAIEEIPDGPPPLYQPRASRRIYSESMPEQDYSDPPTPTSYSPYRVASPMMRVPSRSHMDSSNASGRPNPSSPLSEVHTPGSTSSDRGYSDSRSEKAAYGMNRPGRRPSDPYQRILAAAARGTPPNHHTIPRRGSSSQMSQISQMSAQTLSPTPTGTTPSLISDQQSDYTLDTSSSDLRSRPTSQAFSTYTRGTNNSQSTWGASQATATAIDHHDTDFPPDNGHEDDSTYYASMLRDLDGYEQERSRSLKETLPAKGVRSPPAGKEPVRQMSGQQTLSPPMPQIPRHLMEKQKIHLSDFPLPPMTQPPPGRQLPTPPILQYGSPPSSTQRSLPPSMKTLPKTLPNPPRDAPPPVPHSLFPGGMGWDELNRPVPRKLSKMEKALLRRVEFGAVAASDIASIPLA